MKDNLYRTLYTLFLAAVGIAAAIVADRLFGQYIMITALLTVLYFVGLAVQYWAYELAYFHNYIHNAFHSRGAATDEPSDFPCWGGIDTISRRISPRANRSSVS